MLLADDYLLLAHDDRGGSAIISPKSLALVWVPESRSPHAAREYFPE
jgi:hypothetical protein